MTSDATRFSSREIRYLESLPAVERAGRDRIVYRDGFNRDCVRRYTAGESPAVIFRSAGLDSSLIGYKRIERCIARWKNTIRFDEHAMEGNGDYTIPPERRWSHDRRKPPTGATPVLSDDMRHHDPDTDALLLIITQQARRIDQLERELAELRERLDA